MTTTTPWSRGSAAPSAWPDPVFRDDEAARTELVTTLERDVRRAEQRAELLAGRVRELEAENRQMRAQLADVTPAPIRTEPDGDIYIDGKIVEYIARIIDATHADARDQWILSGALQVDATRIAERAKERARIEGRRYVVPNDVLAAAREVLPGRILVRTGSADDIVADILADVEVP